MAQRRDWLGHSSVTVMERNARLTEINGLANLRESENVKGGLWPTTNMVSFPPRQ